MERLVQHVTAVVGDQLHAVILHGSLATGDFVPGRSDIDLLVVTGAGITDDQAAALERVVVAADLGDASGVDLHVVTSVVAADPVREPPVELHVGRYASGVEVARRMPADPDLPVELAMARAGGRTLLAAPLVENRSPAGVFGEVPARWIVDRGRHWLTVWQGLTEDDQHAAHMVLTACRIWRFAVEGVHCGKVDAARWAEGRDPGMAAIGAAIRRYTTGNHEPVAPAAIARLLDRVLTETSAVAPRGAKDGREAQ